MTCSPCGMRVYSSSRTAAPGALDRGVHLAGVPGRFGAREIDRRRLRLDQRGKRCALVSVGIGLERAPAVERRLQFEQSAIEAGAGHRRRQIADQRRAGPALGQRALGRVVGGVDIEVRQVADEPVRPALARQACLLAGHEFERAMGAEVENRVRAEVLADPTVECRERVGRREPLLEQQPHRVALVAERGLHTDEHVAEPLAEHEQPAAVALVATRRRAPLPLDLGQPALAPHMLVGRNAGDHVGVGTEACGISLGDARAQLVDRGRHVDAVARGLHGGERVVQRRIDRQIRRGAGAAGIRREIEQHDRDLALGTGRGTQCDQLGNPRRQHRGPLGMNSHVAVIAARRRRGAAAEGHRPDRAVEFRDRDHHGGLDRHQPARIALPLLEGLEFNRMRRDVRHIERRQNFFRCARIVVGGPADQREAGQGDDRVDDRPVALHEVALDRRPRIEPAGEGGQHPQAFRLQRGDDAVVVSGVAGEHVGPHHQQSHHAGLAAPRQMLDAFADPLPRLRMIEPDVGIMHRRRRPEPAAQPCARAVGVAVDQHSDQVREVLLRAREPVLQREEIGAHVLRLAGNEAQQPRQLAQHLHLALTARTPAGAVAAQPLEPPDRAQRFFAHVEFAEPGQLDDLAGRHAAQHRVAVVPARNQRRHDGADVILQKQHGADDDVAARDVGTAARERRLIFTPLVGRMNVEFQAGKLSPQHRPGARRRAGQMTVQRHDDDANRRHISGRSALWHRTRSRR